MSATATMPLTTTASYGLRPRLTRMVPVVLGGLLLTAAALKLYGLNVTAVPKVGWFSTPRVQVAAVAWEAVLGIWLLSGSYRAGAWLAAVGTFAAFAAVSGYFGWIGVANCGCFGVIKASPWAAFGVDATALALLALGRPELFGGALRLPAEFVWAGVGGAALLIALTAVGTSVYGSPQAALAKLRGESLGVVPGYLDFGSCSAGQEVKAVVEVRNFSGRSLRIHGGTSDCSCVTTLDLPLTIPAGESRSLTVQLNVPATKPGAFTRVALLFADNEENRPIRLRVGCTVTK